ncbi:hypothetical protein [Caballeronia arationis]|jgi:hypothetical protein|uniref:hypothetical protein n=1 Tax=Caballeronia arationis TaxID=1777142 RepID=UPI000B186F57|nr:hypothetical protein [Caballeronia arationis]
MPSDFVILAIFRDKGNQTRRVCDAFAADSAPFQRDLLLKRARFPDVLPDGS